MPKLDFTDLRRAYKAMVDLAYMPSGLTPAEQTTWRTMYHAVYSDTQAIYKARLAANGAVYRTRSLYKPLPLTTKSAATDYLAGWGIRYGSPQYRDRHSQYFTAKSNLHLEAYSGSIPIFWNHTPERVGVRMAYDLHDFGIWFLVKLHESARKAAILRDAQRGLIGFSSGSILHMAQKRAGDGLITSWPLAELSLLPVTEQSERSLSGVIPFFYRPGDNRQ